MIQIDLLEPIFHSGLTPEMFTIVKLDFRAKIYILEKAKFLKIFRQKVILYWYQCIAAKKFF